MNKRQREASPTSPLRRSPRIRARLEQSTQGPSPSLLHDEPSCYVAIPLESNIPHTTLVWHETDAPSRPTIDDAPSRPTDPPTPSDFLDGLFQFERDSIMNVFYSWITPDALTCHHRMIIAEEENHHNHFKKEVSRIIRSYSREVREEMKEYTPGPKAAEKTEQTLVLLKNIRAFRGRLPWPRRTASQEGTHDVILHVDGLLEPSPPLYELLRLKWTLQEKLTETNTHPYIKRLDELCELLSTLIGEEETAKIFSSRTLVEKFNVKTAGLLYSTILDHLPWFKKHLLNPTHPTHHH